MFLLVHSRHRKDRMSSDGDLYRERRDSRPIHETIDGLFGSAV